MKDKVIFLDRDGTINKEVNYLYKAEDFEFIQNAPDAIKTFHQKGFKVIVITNQAGVAHGFYNEEDVRILHHHIDELLLKEGTYIDAYYFCPHHPNGSVLEYSGSCECRKPNTGMLKKALRDFDIDLERSYIVGDKEIDIETGKNFGLGKCILVRSGHPVDESSSLADEIYDSIFDFANTLIPE